MVMVARLYLRTLWSLLQLATLALGIYLLTRSHDAPPILWGTINSALTQALGVM